MKRVILFILTLLLLSTACSANLDALPTDGLTGAMSANQTSAPNDESCTGSQCWIFANVTACEGTFDPIMNVMRTSFEFADNETAFKGSDEELALFSLGNPLLGKSDDQPKANIRYRCVGEAELTAVPLVVDGQVVGHTAVLQVPKLRLESPAAGADVYEDITFRGVTADNLQAVNGLIGTVNGLPNYDGYLPYLQGQKALFNNYPNSQFLQERALNQGVSAKNAALIGQLFVERDEAKQMEIMLEIVVSEGDELVEAVVMSTVDTMHAAGADDASISALFAEETNGRITVQFVDGNGDSSAQVTSRDDSGNVEVTVSSEKSEGEGETPPEGGGGTDPNDGEDPGGTDPNGGEGGSDPNGGDGGTDPNGGDGGTDPNGGDGGGNSSPWDILKGLFRDVLIGALEGAITGILMGGLPGAIAGAGAGAVVGGLKFALGQLDNGVWINPDAGEGHPCLNPFLNC